MKKVLNIFLVICILFMSLNFNIKKVNAEVKKIGYSIKSITVRNSPSTSATAVDYLDPGIRVNYISESSSGNGCNGNWYYVSIYSNSKKGYVCSDYITLYDIKNYENNTPTTEYEQYLYDNGFKDPTYWPYLTKLHEKYPNWQFVAYIPNKNIEFNSVVSEESDALGKSLIQLCTTKYEGWKHLESYDYKTNKFYNGYSGGGECWYAANGEVVAYYLDPRNFLNERNIFMFETLSFDSVNHTLEGVENFLKGSFMEGKPEITDEDKERDLTYAQIILSAASTHNISPYFLIARIFQELGKTGRNTIISGTVEGYENYFNFYNINATGEQDQIITNGLKYAKNHEWDSEYDAIIGGAEFIKEGYLDAGQDNLYLQKWDIVGDYYFTNQYMQNIQAPSFESLDVFYSYEEQDLLNTSFVFKIPVYKNMSEYTDLPTPANPNNWLSLIAINGEQIDNFDPEITEYSISTKFNTIKIGANPIYNGATINNIGEISLLEKETKHIIDVVAENGTKRTYTLNITKLNSEEPSILEIMDNSGVKYDDKYVNAIAIGTKVNTLISNIKDYAPSAEVTITDSNKKVKTTESFGTGDIVKITSAGETKEYSVVIYGDLNGDGEITILDLLRVQKIILKSTNLSEVYIKAGDVTKDNTVDILDLLRVQKHILGASTIVQ